MERGPQCNTWEQPGSNLPLGGHGPTPSRPGHRRPNPIIDQQNKSTVTEFSLLGLSSHPELQPVIFALILTMYLVNLAGNSLIITVAWTDPKQQTPMYFLLSQLSCVDVAFASITVPQFLVHTFSKRKAIPYGSCFVQMTFSLSAGNMEGYLLVTMAYAHYVAICRHLHCAAAMTHGLCVCLVTGSWVLVTLLGALHGIRLSLGSYCNNPILHFFGAAVLSLSSASGLRKAVSTCGYHLLVVTLFYGTVIYLCFQPPGHSSLEQPMESTVWREHDEFLAILRGPQKLVVSSSPQAQEAVTQRGPSVTQEGPS
ncbi:olfactory receptor 1361-like [Tachyglossus aculeatus]|uniref:olfactory receptor 1361-like n=1 Tax=Tachyglossus aculeatus TaxID=9261 RepID=UPI0018F69F2C|nr:olfactory receptor 1361-like [Tachyglossus aculeatus]